MSTGNVYQGGDADARQEGDIKPSRFRPRYRKLSDEEVLLHDRIKVLAVDMEHLFNAVPKCREQALAMTKLEEAVMWAVKALTA